MRVRGNGRPTERSLEDIQRDLKLTAAAAFIEANSTSDVEALARDLQIDAERMPYLRFLAAESAQIDGHNEIARKHLENVIADKALFQDHTKRRLAQIACELMRSNLQPTSLKMFRLQP